MNEGVYTDDIFWTVVLILSSLPFICAECDKFIVFNSETQ